MPLEDPHTQVPSHRRQDAAAPGRRVRPCPPIARTSPRTLPPVESRAPLTVRAAVRRLPRLAGSALARADLHRRLGREPDGFGELFETHLSKIEGWRYRQDLALLFALARDVDVPGCVMEIGSFKGLATTALAFGSREAAVGGGVHTVDPHTGDKQDLEWSGEDVKPSERDFRRNIRAAGIEDLVTAYVMTSDELSDEWSAGDIRVLFIDGWHGYEAVASDIANWVPRLTAGGVVVIDDYLNYEDVRRAVDESPLLADLDGRRAGRMWIGSDRDLPESARRMLALQWG